MLDRLGREIQKGDVCVAPFPYGESVHICIVLELESGRPWTTIRDLDDIEYGTIEYRARPWERELLVRPV